MSVTFSTTVGDIKVEIFCDQVPKTAENFLGLCASNYYTGCIFHRNIKGFIVQTGDPSGSGKGGSSIWGGEFEDELVPNLKHSTRGILSMANRGKDTNGSQFFITYGKQSHLDGTNTVFGRVIDGMDALEALERVPVDSSNRPIQQIKINEVRIHSNPIADGTV